MIHRFKDACFAFPQYLLPHHPLSRIMHGLTRCRTRWWKNFIIQRVTNHYGIDLREAEEPNPKAYANFNRFFTRALKDKTRPLPKDQRVIVSPADGSISQIGTLEENQILQAKGKYFNVCDLLGGNTKRAKPFVNGNFATVYLSPKDYHRLHMPFSGTLKEMIHIPGRLFSVNPATTAVIPSLFARNERVIVVFETEIGPMALILVGAIFVSSIETVWHGVVTPPSSKKFRTWNYSDKPVVLDRGAEMGRFNMGSTIIILFSRDRVCWLQTLSEYSKILMGQPLSEHA